MVTGGVLVTHLHRMMLEELQRRNYAKSTVKTYIRIIQEFASHFHQSPDRLGPQHLRQYQAYLFQEKKLDAGTVQQHVAALRFFYVKATLFARRYSETQTLSQAPGGLESRGSSAAHRLGQ